MLAALEAVPFISDLLMGAGLGAFLGALVAYRHERRGGQTPRDWVVTRWSAGGAAASLVFDLLLELT